MDAAAATDDGGGDGSSGSRGGGGGGGGRAAADAGDTDGLAGHATTVERALHSPGGHVARFGAAGTGKKSVGRLAARAAGHPVVQLHAHAGYWAADFSADVRATLRRAVGGGGGWGGWRRRWPWRWR